MRNTTCHACGHSLNPRIHKMSCPGPAKTPGQKHQEEITRQFEKADAGETICISDLILTHDEIFKKYGGTQ